MDGVPALTGYLTALGAPTTGFGAGRWRVELESAGFPLLLELTVRGELVRAEAVVLPPNVLDPHQLLFWNGQAPLICFAENRDGEVLVCGEVPVRSLDGELLDRFLGVLHASATRAREFVLRGETL